MSTTFSTGVVITSTFLNLVQDVLNTAAFETDGTSRITFSTLNSDFDISGSIGTGASNITLTGSVSVTGSTQNYAGISFRTLTSTVTGGSAAATCYEFLHTTTTSGGTFGYGVNGVVNSTSGVGKISGVHGIADISGTFSGTANGMWAGLSLAAQPSLVGTSVMQVEFMSTGAYTCTAGVDITGNSTGTLSNGVQVDNSVSLGN